jgi:thiol-disulfide isomerase/thioredoxin
VGAAAALAGLGGALWRETQRGLDPGFWALRFPTPEGGELRLDAYRGQMLLLNFWATWCPPCVREMPVLDRFQRAQVGRGWQVIGLAIDGSTPVREFLARAPVGYPIGLAGLGGTTLVRQLGNESGGLPFTVVVDSRGHLRHRHLGELSEDVLKGWAADA